MELIPVSSSLGAMGSLPRKLDELLATGHWALRGAVVMDGIKHLAADLHELQSLLLNLSNAQDPPVAAGCWMKEVRELSYDVEDCAELIISLSATKPCACIWSWRLGRHYFPMLRLLPLDEAIANIQELKARVVDV